MGNPDTEESTVPLLANLLPERDPPPYVSSENVPSASRDIGPLADTGPGMTPPMDSRNPIPACDARFADIVMTNIIAPRVQVGVLQWEDNETLKYIRQTGNDVFPILIKLIKNRERKEFGDHHLTKNSDISPRNINFAFMSSQTLSGNGWAKQAIVSMGSKLLTMMGTEL